MTRAVSLATALCIGATALACAGPAATAPYGDRAAGPPGPPPPGAPPPPPGYGVPDGQWVYTAQYGWIWMTTGDAYVWVPPDGRGQPVQYVYYGPAGWTWISAPWVWGYGPRPYWGRSRPERFAWYRRGHWRSPQRWTYTAAPERAPAVRRGVAPPPAQAAPSPPRVERSAAPPPAARQRPPAPEQGAGRGEVQGRSQPPPAPRFEGGGRERPERRGAERVEEPSRRRGGDR